MKSGFTARIVVLSVTTDLASELLRALAQTIGSDLTAVLLQGVTLSEPG